jgi:hypothetical protein
MLRFVSALTTLLMSTVVAQTTFQNDTTSPTNVTDGPIILDATYTFTASANISNIMHEINAWFDYYEQK